MLRVIRRKFTRAGTVAEYFLSVVSRGGRIAWDTSEKEEFEFVRSFEQAKQAIRDVSERGIISMSTNGVSPQLRFD